MDDADLKPRKLPKQLRSKETVDAIFEAAMQILDRTDVGDPSVQKIADRAGVSVGSLYQYFPSKESLVNALIRFHLTSRNAELAKELERVKGMTGEQAAARLVEGLIGDKRARIKLEAAMVRYFIRVGDLMTLTEQDGQMNGLVKQFIESLGDQVRPVNTEIAAFLISNLLRTAVLMTLVQKPERLHDPEFKAELTRMVIAYLKPEPRP